MSRESDNCNLINHKIQLQLGDAYGVKVPGTEFWITLTILKDGPRVTMQIPCINFETGQFANDPYEIANPVLIVLGTPAEFATFAPPPQNGGYLFTSKGFLPKELRPTELINLSYIVASNDGMNIPYSYVVDPNSNPPVVGVTYTPQVPAFMIQINNQGALIVQGVGTLANIIPPGTHSLLPTTINYLIKREPKLCNNTRISSGEINTAVFPFTLTDHRGAANGLRDTHVNDAYDGVVAYAWSDNSNVADKPNNSAIMNLAVSIGRVKNGKLKMSAPIFLHQSDRFVFDTAIAINRTNSKNIVVSWSLLDFGSPGNGQPRAVNYRAVTFDGGITWPYNGPADPQPTGEFIPGIPGGPGETAGVRADKFGNFWYLSTNANDSSGTENEIDQPFVLISSDGGVTYTLAYMYPVPLNGLYDFPQMTFGGDGSGNYGLYINVGYFPNVYLGTTDDGYPVVVFIPITGLGTYLSAQIANLTQFLNGPFASDITASQDGRVWISGSPAGLGPAAYPFPGSANVNNNLRLIYKSPGPLDENYVGPWTTANANLLQNSLFFPEWSSQPVFGIFNSVKTVLYDEKLKVLYVLFSIKTTDETNNSQIYLIISGNNGQTWSNSIKIATTDCNNRGFQSMALDTVTGNLLIGWYDGRKYSNATGLNYYGAVVTAQDLKELTSQIPRSNPVYSTISLSSPKPKMINNSKTSNKKVGLVRHRKHLSNSVMEKKENTTTASSTTSNKQH